MIYYAKLLKDGLEYKGKNNLYFRYYTNEQFKKYEKNANILGCVYLNPKTINDDIDKLVVLSKETNFEFQLLPLSTNKKGFGYIYVGDNQFVRIIQNTNLGCIIIPIFMFIAILICGISLFLFNISKQKQIENQKNKPIPSTEEIIDMSEEQIEIPIFDSYNLTIQNSSILLKNPTNNTVSFQYKLYNGDELIHECILNPNEKESINMYNLLGKGNFDIKFEIHCFDGENEVNGTEEIVKINIVEDEITTIEENGGDN